MNGVSQEIMECQRESETAAKQLEELEQELQLYMNQKRLIDNKIADVLGDKYWKEEPKPAVNKKIRRSEEWLRHVKEGAERERAAELELEGKR